LLFFFKPLIELLLSLAIVLQCKPRQNMKASEYRAEHQGDGRDQFAHQEALVPPGKCFFIDMNIAAAQLCFELHVHFATQ
jgi:hypothetical protein